MRINWQLAQKYVTEVQLLFYALIWIKTFKNSFVLFRIKIIKKYLHYLNIHFQNTTYELCCLFLHIFL